MLCISITAVKYMIVHHHSYMSLSSHNLVLLQQQTAQTRAATTMTGLVLFVLLRSIGRTVENMLSLPRGSQYCSATVTQSHNECTVTVLLAIYLHLSLLTLAFSTSIRLVGSGILHVHPFSGQPWLIH